MTPRQARRRAGSTVNLRGGTFVVLAAVVAVASTAAWAQPNQPVERKIFRGTIGPYRIGAEFDVADKVNFVGGLYYYASELKDIPLKGSLAGPDLTVREPDGGVFHLHFVDNAGTSPDLTFYTSTGLAGTWTKGGTTFPARLVGDFSFSAAPGRDYADVTTAPDATFEAMVRRFLDGVVTGDRAKTSGAVHFPLRINRQGGGSYTVDTAADLDARWDRIFTPAYVAAVKSVIPHQLFTHDGQAMIGDGLAWFDGRGAVSINPPLPR